MTDNEILIRVFLIWLATAAIFRIIAWIDWKFSNHNLSWFGFKEYRDSYGMFYVIWLFGLFIFGIIALVSIIKWLWFL